MKDFIKLAGTLCAITFIAAALLAGTNALTKDRIAAAAEEKQQSAMRALLPEAEKFDIFNNNENIYMGTDSEGNIVGFCVSAASAGYGGDVELMVGIDEELKLSGVEILSNSETAGLGANCTKDDFKAQFAGLSTPVSVVKGGGANGVDQINALTGATITSKAVVSGVNAAYDDLEKALIAYVQEGGDE